MITDKNSMFLLRYGSENTGKQIAENHKEEITNLHDIHHIMEQNPFVSTSLKEKYKPKTLGFGSNFGRVVSSTDKPAMLNYMVNNIGYHTSHLAKNPNLTSDHITHLLTHSPVISVAEEIARRPDLTKEHIDRLIEHPDPYVRRELGRQKLTKDQQDFLAKHDGKYYSKDEK